MCPRGQGRSRGPHLCFLHCWLPLGLAGGGCRLFFEQIHLKTFTLITKCTLLLLHWLSFSRSCYKKCLNEGKY